MSARDYAEEYEAFERWAVEETAASPYTDEQFEEDITGEGSPNWCVPNGCFLDAEREYRK